jgi:hypothetical protein
MEQSIELQYFSRRYSMATISQICFVGSDLLSDSDIHLDRLLDSNLISSVAISALFLASIAFGYKVGRNYKR